MKSIAGLRCSVMVLGVLASAFAQAQGIVGRTAGEASVSATGAARYTIPLTLPPGTNGLAPALAVTYDSRSGNGLLGVGFRLTGLSAIQRCGNTLAQDGRLGAVALDSADRFCLDGQRLRLDRRRLRPAGLPVPDRARDVRARDRDRHGGHGARVVPCRAQRRADLRIRHDARCTRRVRQQRHAARVGVEPDSRSQRQLRRLRLRGGHGDRQPPSAAHRLHRQPADRRRALLLGAVPLRGAPGG